MTKIQILDEIQNNIKQFEQILKNISRPPSMKSEDLNFLNLVTTLDSIVLEIYNTPDRGNKRLELKKNISEKLRSIYGEQASGDPWNFITAKLQSLQGTQSNVTLHTTSTQLPVVQKNIDSGSLPEPVLATASGNIPLSENTSAIPPTEITSATGLEPLASRTYDQSMPTGPSITIYLNFFNSGKNDFQIVASALKGRIETALDIYGQARTWFEYRSLSDLSLDKSFSVASVESSEELKNLGLETKLDGQGLVIEGTPNVFNGQLNFVFKNLEAEGSVLLCKSMSIVDPRSLWQNLNVEDDEGYPAPDTDQKALFFPALGKTLVAASCRGRSHAHVGKARDDYFITTFNEISAWHFAAVADGAGSAKYSRKGAELACKTITQQLGELLTAPEYMEKLTQLEDKLKDWKALFEANQVTDKAKRSFLDIFRFDDIMYTGVYKAYMAISAEAAAKGRQVRDYHSTLLCTAFRKFSFGYFFIHYWIGDGGLALYNWNGCERVIVPGVPDGGEFAGQTRFLTMMKEEINPEAVYKRTRYSFADDFEALIMMTDGVADPFFPSESDVTDGKKWQEFWNGPLKNGFDDNSGCKELFDDSVSPERKSLALLKWLDFWSKGNHDDRTILIIK